MKTKSLKNWKHIFDGVKISGVEITYNGKTTQHIGKDIYQVARENGFTRVYFEGTDNDEPTWIKMKGSNCL